MFNYGNWMRREAARKFAIFFLKSRQRVLREPAGAYEKERADEYLLGEEDNQNAFRGHLEGRGH